MGLRLLQGILRFYILTNNDITIHNPHGPYSTSEMIFRPAIPTYLNDV